MIQGVSDRLVCRCCFCAVKKLLSLRTRKMGCGSFGRRICRTNETVCGGRGVGESLSGNRAWATPNLFFRRKCFSGRGPFPDEGDIRNDQVAGNGPRGSKTARHAAVFDPGGPLSGGSVIGVTGPNRLEELASVLSTPRRTVSLLSSCSGYCVAHFLDFESPCVRTRPHTRGLKCAITCELL